MKNDSHLFPFHMPGDGFFDSNKDGKLTGFETVMRDAHHLEMMNRTGQVATQKMLALQKKLHSVEENRKTGTEGYSVKELDEILDESLKKR